MSTPVAAAGRVPAAPRVRVVVVALACALIVIGGGAAAGSSAIAAAVVPGEPGVPAGLPGAGGFIDTLLGILALNLPVAASLAAGIVSAGVLTAVSGLLLGLYLGATVSGALNTVGTGALLASVLPYAGIEMLGLAAVAVAGFMPVASAFVGGRRAGVGPARRYAAGVAPAAVIVVAAVLLLLVAAVVEAAVIVGPGS